MDILLLVINFIASIAAFIAIVAIIYWALR